MATTTTKTKKPLIPRAKDYSPSPIGYNRAALYSGKALDFDGVNDYVDLDGFTLSGTTATFVFNLKADSPSFTSKYVFDTNAINISKLIQAVLLLNLFCIISPP